MKQGNISTFDYDIILAQIERGSKVLDLGCGNGDLSLRMKTEKQANVFGVEIDENKVIECVRKRLDVYQGDLEEGLAEFEDQSYDWVILSKTLQVVHNVSSLVEGMLRVGKKVLVSFPNFFHYSVVGKFLITGRMPKSKSLPFEWYNTPNIRELTLRDFKAFCRERGAIILKEILISNGKVQTGLGTKIFSNFLVEEGMYIITKK